MATEPLIRKTHPAGGGPPRLRVVPAAGPEPGSERKGTGRREPEQVLYPLQLPERHLTELKRLRDAAFLQRRLRQVGIKVRLGKARRVKPNDEPKLLEVRHDPDAWRLEFRWVWLRYWAVRVKDRRGVPDLVPRSGPAMSSFVVDLESGRAALRIPRLEPNTAGGVTRQLQKLRRAARGVQKVIDLDRFEPIRTEPVIRKLLRSLLVRIDTWSVDVRGKGRLGGAGDPGLLRMIVWRLQRIRGRKLVAEWFPDRPARERVVTRLFGASDRVDVLEPCSPESLERALAALTDLTEEPIRVPEIAAVVHKHSKNQTLRSQAERIDFELDPGRSAVVDPEELFGVQGENPRTLAAVRHLVAEAPDCFRLDAEDRLRYRPPAPVPEHGLLYLLKRLLSRFVSGDRLEQLLRVLAHSLFAFFFCVAVLAATWGWAQLWDSYPDARVLIAPSYLLCLLLLAALVELVLGRPATGRALQMVKELADIAAKLASPVTAALGEGGRRLLGLLRNRWRAGHVRPIDSVAWRGRA